MKDGEVLDGGWDLYPLGRHNTGRFDWSQHTTCKLQAAFSCMSLLVADTMYEKTFFPILQIRPMVHTRDRESVLKKEVK